MPRNGEQHTADPCFQGTQYSNVEIDNKYVSRKIFSDNGKYNNKIKQVGKFDDQWEESSTEK